MRLPCAESRSPSSSSSASTPATINADLRLLIETIARACKGISTRVNKGALADGHGSAGTENVQGEVQKKLDVLSNEILLEANEWGGNLAALASEEMDNPQPIPTHYPQAASTCCCSTRSTARPTSTSTSRSAPSSRCCAARRRRAASTASRTRRPSCSPGASRSPPASRSTGPTTVFVLTVGDGAHGFTLDRETYTFVLTHPDIRIPADTAGIRHQRVEPAALGAAGAALHRRVPGRQGRAARQGLQHALGGLDGGRRVPRAVPRRHLHVPARRQRTRKAGCA